MIRPFSQWLRRAFNAALGALCLTFLAQPVSAQPLQQDGNLLVNGGFEWPYNEDFRSDGGGFVAHGWNAWWYNDPGGDFDAPEFKGASIEEDASRVRDGVVAQQYFRPWARHMGGLWQRVAVPTSSHVRFTVWGHAWSTFCAGPGPNTPGLDCDPRNSFHGSVNPIVMKVGIDPTGNTDALNASVIWSSGQGAYDNYQQFSIEADAQGDFVTVFVYSSPEWAAPVINVYWDNAVLTASRPVRRRGPASNPPPAAQSTATPPVTATETIATLIDPNTATQQYTHFYPNAGCIRDLPEPVPGCQRNGLREVDELHEGGISALKGRSRTATKPTASASRSVLIT
jgi:hypothetical protein